MSDEPLDPRYEYPRPHRNAPAGEHRVSAKVQTVGMIFFLLGLALVFASGMLIYVIARYQMSGDLPFGSFRAQMGDPKLFLSTVIVLSASVAIHVALKSVQREKMKQFRRWLWITNGLAVAFVLVQTPAMIGLLSLDPAVTPDPPIASAFTGANADTVASPRDLMPAARPERLWAILFFFVLIHALHVIGGIIYLAIVTWKAKQHLYDHEHYIGVRHAALYWHFLDVVWLVMFGTFLALG